MAALATAVCRNRRHRLQHQNAGSLPGGPRLRTPLSAGRSQEYLEAHRTPGLSRGAAPGHLALAAGTPWDDRPRLAAAPAPAKRPAAAIAGVLGHVAAHHGHLF